MLDGEDGEEAPDAARRYERLTELHAHASTLMVGLDELGLHAAAAYVSLPRRRIRDQHPRLAMHPGDDSDPA
jgi:hypothetical protein